MKLAQLVTIEVRFSGSRHQPEELPTHIFGVIRLVGADLLRKPMAPDGQADPLHDVVGVAGAADGIAVCAADSLGALERLWVVAEEVGLGVDGKVFEQVGFGGKDGDNSGPKISVA